MAEQTLNIEGILELFRRSDRRSKREFREMRRVMKERLQESATEFDRRMAEADRQTAEIKRQMKRTDQKIGELTGSMGRVIERMVGGRSIIKQFKDLDYVIECHSRNVEFGESMPDNMKGEIDLFLENGDVAIVIEVKTTFKEKNVGALKDTLERFRRYSDLRGDKRRFIGAIAGAVIEPEAIQLAHENGFYVIVQSGKAMQILPTPEGFVAREW